MARGKIELFAIFGFGPLEHGFPEGGADTLATTIFIRDEVFEIGVFSDERPHDDTERSDALNFSLFVRGKEHIVIGRINNFVKPFFGDFSTIFTAAG